MELINGGIRYCNQMIAQRSELNVILISPGMQFPRWVWRDVLRNIAQAESMGMQMTWKREHKGLLTHTIYSIRIVGKPEVVREFLLPLQEYQNR